MSAAPEPPPADDRPFEERVAAYQDEFVMREDETLADLLARFDAQAELTLAALAQADPATPVPVPQDAPWFPKDVTHWSVRWVALHLVEELARHAGHADIIREASTAPRCTSWSPAARAGRRPTGSSRGSPRPARERPRSRVRGRPPPRSRMGRPAQAAARGARPHARHHP